MAMSPRGIHWVGHDPPGPPRRETPSHCGRRRRRSEKPVRERCLYAKSPDQWNCLEWKPPRLRLGPRESRTCTPGSGGLGNFPNKFHGRDDRDRTQPPLRDVDRPMLSMVAQARVPWASRFAGRPTAEEGTASRLYRSALQSISVSLEEDQIRTRIE